MLPYLQPAMRFGDMRKVFPEVAKTERVVDYIESL